MHKSSTLISVSITAVIASIMIFMIAGCERFEKKKYVIAIVNPNPEDKPIAQGFIKSMAKYGYVEGKNSTYILSENMESMESDLRNIAIKKVDLIFTITTPAAKSARKVTEGTKIPVVFVMYDAVESGVVKSLIHPGGNLTGIQIRGSTPKALEWLLLAAPKVKHIYLPIAFDTRAAHQSLEDIKRIIAKLRIKLTISEVNTVDELKASLSAMPKEVDAIFIPHSILIISQVESIVDAAIKRKLPVASSGHEEYHKGVMICYGQNQFRTGENASRLAHSILKGTPPSDLPVELTDFFLSVNLKTANAVGIKIPDDILLQADFIVR